MRELATLTEKQMQVVMLIHRRRESAGIGPTLSEMAKEMGTSKETVHEHIDILVRKRVLNKERYAKRGTQLTKRWRSHVRTLEAARVSAQRPEPTKPCTLPLLTLEQVAQEGFQP